MLEMRGDNCGQLWPPQDPVFPEPKERRGGGAAWRGMAQAGIMGCGGSEAAVRGNNEEMM